MFGRRDTRARGPATWAAAALAAAMVVTLLAMACTLQQEISPLEQRVQDLNRALMCPVCPGESIDQSQNDLAKQMRVIVREQMEQGWSDTQIKDFWVERYGPSVLMEPPQQGFNLLAWVVPPIAVAGGGLSVYLVLRAMRRSERAGGQEAITVPDLSEEERAGYFRRIETALDPGQRSQEPNGSRRNREGVND